jgi:hypothetical protein
MLKKPKNPVIKDSSFNRVDSAVRWPKPPKYAQNIKQRTPVVITLNCSKALEVKSFESLESVVPKTITANS